MCPRMLNRCCLPGGADDLEARLLKKATLEKVAPAPVAKQAEKPKASGGFSFFGGGAKEAPKAVAVTKAAAPAKAAAAPAKVASAKAKTVAVTKETAKAVAPKTVAAAPKPGRWLHSSVNPCSGRSWIRACQTLVGVG